MRSQIAAGMISTGSHADRPAVVRKPVQMQESATSMQAAGTTVPAWPGKAMRRPKARLLSRDPASIQSNPTGPRFWNHMNR
jgi:hypothetical protein